MGTMVRTTEGVLVYSDGITVTAPDNTRFLKRLYAVLRRLKEFDVRLFWMAAIVAEHSIGRVWQEEGERNGEAFWFLNGTDPSLQIALRMTYTTRPSQDLVDQ
uniref:RNase H domain-containing protein n=1 Tax=Heterorhabditis bacteriophora TaxID=37862 RepID=A0A1I7X154_HETBA